MEIIRTTGPTTDIQNLVRVVATEIWSNGNIERVDDVYTDNFTGRILGAYQFDGRDDYKSWVRDARTAIPNLEITINKLFIGGAIVCGTWTATGTHTGEFRMLGLEPTHETVKYDGMVIARLNNTKIIEEYHAGDYITLLSQLGVLSQ